MKYSCRPDSCFLKAEQHAKIKARSTFMLKYLHHRLKDVYKQKGSHLFIELLQNTMLHRMTTGLFIDYLGIIVVNFFNLSPPLITMK